MFKYNNSYIIYFINKTIWKIKNKQNKKKMQQKEWNMYIKKQKECIWCKKIHIKNSYFCSKKCEKLYNNEKYQAFKHNNRCKFHKFQKLTYKNQCWSCYMNQFTKNKHNYLHKSLVLKLHGFKIIPTFRTSKENWNGDKIAFEQYLVDTNIGWFVYIKFYENKQNQIKPLVVGKSGSLMVNHSGSDLNFSRDIKDGNARKFLYYNKLYWYYDNIMIKKCKNEEQAYKIENKIMKKFDLFGS